VAYSLGVKRLGRVADYSPPSSAEVKTAWSYISTPQHVFMTYSLGTETADTHTQTDSD